jgi:phosphoribosylanthranilate isomerase
MTAVKICGITNADDAVCACEHGADMIGFVFAESRRRTDIPQARSILETLDRHGLLSSIKTAAVFVNESTEIMESVLKETGIDYAQIHGDENAGFCNGLPFPWYRALRINDMITAETAAEEVPLYGCGIILADALSSAGYGGTGERVSADAAVLLRDAVRKSGKRFFLAGGITDENAARIIETIQPDGIDISSGLEDSPGRKSYRKISNLFINIQRMYHRNSGEYYV